MKGNAIMGFVMVIVGGYFFAFPSAHIGTPIRIVFLIGYIGVASFYLGKAFMQYRAGQ